jgi:phage-related tail protein
MEELEKQQIAREKLLRAILTEFNEGRSKTLYCVAATILEISELESVLKKARATSKGLDIREKSEVMHSLLNEIAASKDYLLKLRR